MTKTEILDFAVQRYQKLLEIRKAHRDSLFKKYGNEWRNHEDSGSFWNENPNNNREREALERAGYLVD